MSLITNIFKCKTKYVLFLVMLILCFMLMLVLVNTKQYYQDILENGLGTEIFNRKFIVINTEEDTLDHIKKAPHIMDYYPYVYLNGSFDELNFDLGYVTTHEYEVLQGKEIQHKNEIIVPKKLDKYLDESINIQINQEEYSLKVVGVGDLASIVISRELLDELLINDHLNIGYYVLIADNYKYAQKNIDDFSEEGYISNFENTSGLSEYNNMQSFISMLTKFIYLMIIFTFIFIIYIIKNIFHLESKNIAILKAIGYSDLNIGFVIVSKILILLLISIVLSMLIFIIMIYLLGTIFHTDYILFSRKYHFINNYLFLCVDSIILLLINYISIFFKIKKIDVVKILNEE